MKGKLILLIVFFMMCYLSVCLTQQGKAGSKDEDLPAVISKAEQGDPEAQKNLGIKYAEGEGIPQDMTQAVYWLTKAAEKGDAEVQVYLGIIYAKGVHVPQDYEKAIDWLTRAAEQGVIGAQLKLGVLYEKGKGIQDYVRAYAWFNIAALHGDETAKEKKNLLIKKMSPSQIEEGKKLSKELDNKIYGQAE